MKPANSLGHYTMFAYYNAPQQRNMEQLSVINCCMSLP